MITQCIRTAIFLVLVSSVTIGFSDETLRARRANGEIVEHVFTHTPSIYPRGIPSLSGAMELLELTNQQILEMHCADLDYREIRSSLGVDGPSASFENDASANSQTKVQPLSFEERSAKAAEAQDKWNVRYQEILLPHQKKIWIALSLKRFKELQICEFDVPWVQRELKMSEAQIDAGEKASREFYPMLSALKERIGKEPHELRMKSAYDDIRGRMIARGDDWEDFEFEKWVEEEMSPEQRELLKKSKELLIHLEQELLKIRQDYTETRLRILSTSQREQYEEMVKL
jgi:hypothetical protein